MAKTALSLYNNKGDIFLLKCQGLHAIFLKLRKKSYFHNYSINIFTIFISLSGFPDPVSNKYNNSYF